MCREDGCWPHHFTADSSEIFTVLSRALRDDLTFQELDCVVAIFEELRRPELAEAMQRLLQNSSKTYAKHTAGLLRQSR